MRVRKISIVIFGTLVFYTIWYNYYASSGNLTKMSSFGSRPYPFLAMLSDTVQENIQRLQNPSNCAVAKKALCNLTLAKHGFGSSMHYFAACLAVAYGLNRTLVLSKSPWVYSPGGWTDLFLPVGKCADYDPSSVKGIGDLDAEIILVPFLPLYFPKRKRLYPPAVPEQIGKKLDGIHSDPKAWWLGQTFKYLLRPTAPIQQRIEIARQRMDLAKPYIGVHVRRTDKIGLDAEFHPIEDYMKHAEDFFNEMDKTQTPLKRTIYLATDTMEVKEEAQKKYPQYEFVNANDFWPSLESPRESVEAIHGVFIDIFFLSHANHLVCTMTSNICRASYEIMQSLHEEASNMTRSLDGPHFYFRGDTYYQQALLPHQAQNKDEIDLQPGDKLLVIYYRFCKKKRELPPHLDCDEQPLNHIYSRGKNLRTDKAGYYPKYKVKNVIQMGF